MGGLHGTLWGEMRNTTAETSGITVNFIKLSDITSGPQSSIYISGDGVLE